MKNNVTEFEQKYDNKKRTIKLVSLALAVIILIIGSYFGYNYLTYPLEAKEKSVDACIFNGEEATIKIDFVNKKNKSATLDLDLGKYGEKKLTIEPLKTKSLTINFEDIKKDTKITGKYGFLNLKKITINLSFIDKTQLSLSKANFRILDSLSKDISNQGYSLPNKEVSFVARIRNDSGKLFKRNYDFKINGKVIETKEAIWDNTKLKIAALTFKYTFTKQGKYKVTIGDTSIDFVVAKADKAPTNGTILKRGTSGGSGVLNIKNANNYDVIATIVSAKNPNKALDRIYIKKNKTATLSGIKDGTYLVQVKGGTSYSKILKDIIEVSGSYNPTNKVKFTTSGSTYTIWNITV